MATEDKVIPFTGYLRPQVQPSPPPPEKSPSPYILFCVGTFVIGLAIGAISIHQSANYQQMQELRTQAQKLSKIRQSICGY